MHSLRRVLLLVLATFCVGTSLPDARAQSTDWTWLPQVRYGDMVYFLFPNEQRLERYDLAQRKWMARISLSDKATAFHVDASGIHIAYGRGLFRRTLDGQSETPIYNTPTEIYAIALDSSFIFLATYDRTYSIRRSDGTLTDSTSFGTYTTHGLIHVAGQNSLILASGSQFRQLPFGSDGKFVISSPGVDQGYSSGSLIASPSQTVILRGGGQLLHTASFSHRGSGVSGDFQHAAFFNETSFAVLRYGRISVYSKDLVEAGSTLVSSEAKSIAIRGNNIFVFVFDTLVSSKIRMQLIPLARITAKPLDTEPDPNIIPLLPDDVIPLEDDTFLMISRLHMKGFRWSASEKRFSGSVDFTSPPVAVAYNPSSKTLFTAYGNRVTRRTYPGTNTVETTFINTADSIRRLVRMDDLLYVATSAGNNSYYDSTATVYNIAGTSLFTRQESNYPVKWNSPKRLLFRIGNYSYGFETASVSMSGTIGSYAYRSVSTYTPDLWVRPDGEVLLNQEGLSYNVSSGTYVAALSNAISQAAFISNRWVTIRSLNNGTQVQSWTPGLLLSGAWSLTGTPSHLFPLSNGGALAITRQQNTIVPWVLSLASGSTVLTPPALTKSPGTTIVALGGSTVLTVEATGTNLTYHWMRNGLDIPGATSASLSLTNLTPATSGTFTVRVTNPHGTVVTAPAFVLVDAPDLVTRPDVNRDGKADILLQQGWSSERRFLTMNLTERSSTLDFPSVTAEWTIVGLGDFDIDAETDFVWRNKITGELVFQFFEGPTLRTHRSLGMIDPEWRVVGVGDFDRDGFADLLWQNVRTRELRLWYMEETTLRSTATLPTSPEDWFVVGVGDFSGDGYPDILWRHRRLGTIAGWRMIDSVFLSGFSLGTTSTRWEIAQISDFTGDGRPDILWHDAPTGSLVLWRMNGTSFNSTVDLGTIQAGTIPGPAPRLRSVAADYNHDGTSDLLFQDASTGTFAYLPLAGGSSAAESASLPSAAAGWTRVGSNDLNGDGQTDAVWRNTTTGMVATWLMRGTQIIDSAILGTVSTTWKIAGVGDFDLDSSRDLVWRNSSTGEVAIWGLVNGRPSGQYYGLGSIPTTWQLVGVDDLNGDTATDLLWVNSSTGQLVGWAMSGRSFTSALYLGSVPAGWTIVQVADFNGDLIADLCRQETATGICVIDFSNGTTLTSSLTLPNVVPAGAKVGHQE